MERRKRRTPLDEYVDSFMDSPEKLQQCTQFYQHLRQFYRRKWNCPLKPPYIQGVELNLSRLYYTVVSFGGWQKVSQGEKWGDVAQAMGVSEGVAVSEYAVKVLYMRYLSKYEQNELVGDAEDTETDLLGSRSRGKGFSSLATADCPVSVTNRQNYDFFRVRTDRKEAEYDRIVKSLMSGLPNEVDFAINVCTLLSHPGPRVLKLASAPQLITLLVAHVAVFADGDNSLYDLYKSWSETCGRDFLRFWQGAGIEDEEILALLHNVRPSKIAREEVELFNGIETELEPRDAVSWRVQQVVSIMRNLSFEVINKGVMAANWPLLKLLFICSNCKWSALRTAALDSLSNISSEIDLMCEESSLTNHLLLKTVSKCLNSGDKLQIIRALEIIAGLCNNEHNEQLLCEFLDVRILTKIFDIITIKDIMMCVYTLEALYQISELGAAACQQVSLYPRAIDTLVDLATVEAVSFGPSGLVGMKVVEFHGPPVAPAPASHHQVGATSTGGIIAHTVPRAAFATPAPPGTYQTPPRATIVHAGTTTRSTAAGGISLNTSIQQAHIGDSKVEQLTAKWLRQNCLVETGNVVPRGELYLNYVDDLRHQFNALAGSVQMFTNILKTIFPQAMVKVGTNSSAMVIENLKLSKGHGLVLQQQAATGPQLVATSIAASHPTVQKMLLSSGDGGAALNTHATAVLAVNGHVGSPLPAHTQAVESGSNSPASTLSEDVNAMGRTTAGDSHINKVRLEVCSAAVEAKEFLSDEGATHETAIVRVENTGRRHGSQVKSVLTRRLNGVLVENRDVVMNGNVKTNGLDSVNNNNKATVVNGNVRIQNGEISRETPSSSTAYSSTAEEVVAAVAAGFTSSSLGNGHAPSTSGGSAHQQNGTAAIVVKSGSELRMGAVGAPGPGPGGSASSVAAVPAASGGTVMINSVPVSVCGAPPGATVVLVVNQPPQPPAQVAGPASQPQAPPPTTSAAATASTSSTSSPHPPTATQTAAPHVTRRSSGAASHRQPAVPLTPSQLAAKRKRTAAIVEAVASGRTTSSIVIPQPKTSISANAKPSSSTDASTAAGTVPTPSAGNMPTTSVGQAPTAQSSSTERSGDYLCEWNGCGRCFECASTVLYHCARDHVGEEESLQCHWPRCDSTVRTKWSMITHLQDHHCSDMALQAAAKRRREGLGIPLGPVNPERPRDAQQHPGYSKNAAVEAIRRHAFNYLPRDITDDPEGPVTKSIRLTSCLILRNLARYSPDGRRLVRRHERLLSWLSLSRLESSSALAQLLAELYQPQTQPSYSC